MPSKNRSADREIRQLLSVAATSDEKESLSELGIKMKSPTKLTVVLAALYKKAAAGDLSAIKELLGKLDPEEAYEKEVVLIDDIKGKA